MRLIPAAQPASAGVGQEKVCGLRLFQDSDSWLLDQDGNGLGRANHDLVANVLPREIHALADLEGLGRAIGEEKRRLPTSRIQGLRSLTIHEGTFRVTRSTPVTVADC